MRRPRHDLRWSFLDKLAAAGSILAAVMAVLWIAFPSAFFVRSIELTYNPETRVFTFVREIRPTWFLMPGADGAGYDARWWSEVVVIAPEPFECHSGAWRNAFYQETTGNAVSYRNGAWIEDCLNAGWPFYIEARRQVMLFGVIPLRPDRWVSDVFLAQRLAAPPGVSGQDG